MSTESRFLQPFCRRRRIVQPKGVKARSQPVSARVMVSKVLRFGVGLGCGKAGVVGVVLVPKFEGGAYLFGGIVADEHAKMLVILRGDVSEDRGDDHLEPTSAYGKA